MPVLNHRIEALDRLRGFAILVVFLFHSLGASFGLDELPWDGAFRTFSAPLAFLALLPLSLGKLGVALFFALSGFCIHLSHSRAADSSFRTFFLRRFFRIYPAYILCVAVFCLPYPWHSIDLTTRAGLASLLSHLALIHNLDSSTYYSINPSFWSIAVEVQLYLLYPLLWLYARRTNWCRVLVIVAALELLLRAATCGYAFWAPNYTLPAWATSNPLGFGFSWCIGAAVADAHLRQHALHFPRWLLAAVGIAIAAAYFFKPAIPLLFPLAAVLSAGVLIRSVTGLDVDSVGRRSNRAGRYLAALGAVSYSFYLIHQPLVDLVPRLLLRVSPSLQHPLIGFAGCLLALIPLYQLSRLLFRWVEEPGIAAGKALAEKLRSGYAPR